jgi:hypothetical protein
MFCFTYNTIVASSYSSSSPRGGGTGPVLVTKPPLPVVEAAFACASSHMLLAMDDNWDSFLASSRRDLICRTESFSIAADGPCFSHGLGEGLKKMRQYTS